MVDYMVKDYRYKKGIVLSIITLLLLGILVQFANITMDSKRHIRESEIKGFLTERVSFIVNDFSQDIRLNLVEVNTPSNDTRTYFVDDHNIDKSQFMSDYNTFLDTYENATGVNISINYTDHLDVIFSDGTIYRTNFSSKVIDIFNGSGTTSDIVQYQFDLAPNTSRSLVNEPTYVSNGTYVIFNWTDPTPAKTFLSSGFVDPTIENTLFVIMPSPFLPINVTVGRIDGINNSARVNHVLTDRFPEINITINRSSKAAVRAYYGFPINISIGTVTNMTSHLPAN